MLQLDFFADDNSLCIVDSNLNTTARIPPNNNLQPISTWASNLLISLNEAKSVSMLVSLKKKNKNKNHQPLFTIRAKYNLSDGPSNIV